MMCDSRVEYDSEALYLNSLPSKISADVPPQYNPNCIFLLDHNRKLPPDDSEPFTRQSSISFVERANSGFIMRRGLVTGFIAVACSAMVVGWMSWKQGRGSGFIFAVQGLSMAPTLLGEHRIATCRVCDVRWPVGLADDPESVTSASVQCFHCGGLADIVENQRPASVVVVHGYEGDQSAMEGNPLRAGDVVALVHEKRLRIKRIAAVPGDIVDLNGSHLIVNGDEIPLRMGTERQLEVPLASMPVDLDSQREVSRWAGNGWLRNKSDAEQAAWENAGSDWLIYQHRSIHEGNKVSCIWDDYPCNIGLSRKLQPARRLVLRGVAHTSDRALLQVVFWIGDQPVGLTWEIERDGEFSVSSDEALPVKNVPVTTVAPVALRVVAGDLKLSRLQLSRQIEYRLRPHDDHTCYPMELASDEYFVVGDNVPVSLDSRNFGVIHRRDVRGRVSLQASDRKGL